MKHTYSKSSYEFNLYISRSRCSFQLHFYDILSILHKTLSQARSYHVSAADMSIPANAPSANIKITL
jgi:hypothetical protein